jgi:hypothetical protein
MAMMVMEYCQGWYFQGMEREREKRMTGIVPEECTEG